MAKKVVNCEVYSRIVGYFRPVSNWNAGKKQEFKERVCYEPEKSVLSSKIITAADCKTC